MPPYSVTYPGRAADVSDDHRIRVQIEPPKLPWPLVYYFTEVEDDDGVRSFVCEGSERGAAISRDQDGADAEPAMQAAEHYRQHADDYEQMARYLCRPIPPNTRRAAEIYVARILRWRRKRRTEDDRLRVRDAYRAWCAEHGGRRHGAMQALEREIYMNRKAVRRALEECVQHAEMDSSEISWRGRKGKVSA